MPRPISGNKLMQLNYIDDSSKVASINLKRSLTEDLVDRPKPLSYHKRGNSAILEKKKMTKILGIQVPSDLRWGTQVEQMIARASKTTCVIRRMKLLGVDRKMPVSFWKSEGRVHLEMAALVWHFSLTLAERKSLERCQRVAMGAIMGYWAPSLPEQLSELALERLANRRGRLCARLYTSRYRLWISGILVPSLVHIALHSWRFCARRGMGPS